jgi:hypothetical protein
MAMYCIAIKFNGNNNNKESCPPHTYIQTAAKKSPKQKTNIYTIDNQNKNKGSVVEK